MTNTSALSSASQISAQTAEQPTPRANGTAHHASNGLEGGCTSEKGNVCTSSASTAGVDDTSEYKQWSEAELISLAEHLQQEIDVRDRVRRFRRYECCFKGTDAVKWLVSNDKAANSEEAVMLGNDMLRAGLLHHVSFKRQFQDKGSLYRFLDVGEASDADDSSCTQSPKPERSEVLEPCNEDYDKREADHDDCSSSRTGALSSASPTPKSSPGPKHVDGGKGAKSCKHAGGAVLRGTNRGTQWSVAAEVTHLQRRVADLAAELQGQQEVNKVLSDVQTLQMKNQQELFTLLQSRLERAIRRGTWLAAQLQLTFVFVMVLLAIQAQLYLSSLPQSTLNRVSVLAVPYIATLLVAAVMFRQPWDLPPKKDAAKGASLDRSEEEQNPEQASEGAEVDSRVQRQPSALVREVDLGSQRLSGQQGTSGAPSVSHFEDWPDAPLQLRPAPLEYQHIPSAAKTGGVRINDGRRIEFETPLFKGCAVIWAQGLPSTPKGLFDGKRRKTSITIQGRFKQELAFEDVVTGQEFGRPAQNLPAKWLVETVLIKLAKRISPSMEIGPLSAPYLLVPVMAMAQVVNVSKSGEEPDPAGSVPEDVRLHDNSLTDSEDGPMPATKRKKYFWAGKHREGRTFDTEHVWTFQLLQHFVDMGKYELNMVYKFDLTRNLDGQPLQFMLKDRKSNQYLLNLHAWHRRLLTQQERNG